MITLGKKTLTLAEAIEHATTQVDPSSGVRKPINAGVLNRINTSQGQYSKNLEIKTPRGGRVVYMPTLDQPYVRETGSPQYKARLVFMRKDMSEAENKELDDIVALFDALKENLETVRAVPGKANPPLQPVCYEVYTDEYLAEYIDEKGSARRQSIYRYTNGEVCPGDVSIQFKTGAHYAPVVGRAYQEEKSWYVQTFLRDSLRDADGNEVEVPKGKNGEKRVPKGVFIGKEWENYIFPGALATVFAKVDPYHNLTGGTGLQARFAMRPEGKPSIVFLPSKSRDWPKGYEGNGSGSEPRDATSIFSESDLSAMTAGFDDLDSLD